MAFCTFMHALYGLTIDAWGALSVQRCLVDELSQNPVFPEDWPENAVPILCRFLTHMEASGRLTNASGLIAALEESEPAFQKAATSPEKSLALFRRILVKAQEAGIDTNDMDAFFNFTMREIARMAGMDPDSEEVQKELSSLLADELLKSGADDLRAFDGALKVMDMFFDILDIKYYERLLFFRIDQKGAIRDHPTALRNARAAGEHLVVEISRSMGELVE